MIYYGIFNRSNLAYDPSISDEYVIEGFHYILEDSILHEGNGGFIAKIKAGFNKLLQGLKNVKDRLAYVLKGGSVYVENIDQAEADMRTTVNLIDNITSVLSGISSNYESMTYHEKKRLVGLYDDTSDKVKGLSNRVQSYGAASKQKLANGKAAIQKRKTEFKGKMAERKTNRRDAKIAKNSAFSSATYGSRGDILDNVAKRKDLDKE